MRKIIDRQMGAFGVAILATLGGTLALGADAPIASYAGAGTLCAAAAFSSGAAPLPRVWWAGMAVMVWLGGQAVAMGQVWVAAPELAAMAGIAAAFGVGVQVGAVPERAKRAAMLLTGILAVLAIAAFVSHVANPDAVLGRPKPYHEGRLTGTFLSANTAATVCGLALALGSAGLARAVQGSGSALRALDAAGRNGLLPGALTLFAAACLIMTGSRAGILAGFFGAAMVLMPMSGLHGIRLPVAVSTAGVAVVLLASSGGVLGDRLTGLGAGDSGRTVLWQTSIMAWLDAPLFGHGLGSYPRALAAQLTVETAPSLSVQGAAHNVILQWLVQTGLLGTAFGAAILLMVVRLLIVGLGRRRGRWIAQAATGAFAVFALHGLVDYAFEVPAATWWLALLVGLGAGVANAPSSFKERRKSGR